jgi:hypothetical protein
MSLLRFVFQNDYGLGFDAEIEGLVKKYIRTEAKFNRLRRSNDTVWEYLKQTLNKSGRISRRVAQGAVALY